MDVVGSGDDGGGAGGVGSDAGPPCQRQADEEVQSAVKHIARHTVAFNHLAAHDPSQFLHGVAHLKPTGKVFIRNKSENISKSNSY